MWLGPEIGRADVGASDVGRFSCAMQWAMLMPRDSWTRGVVGTLLVVACFVPAQASAGQVQPGRVPYSEHSPFEGLYQLPDVSTSNDEYGITLTWHPTEWSLAYPDGRGAFSRTEGLGDRALGIVIGCRADGRPEGLSGPTPVYATLVVPMHPEAPDVYNFLQLRYWWLGLTGNEFERTSVHVDVAGAGTMESELVRKRIDYSFARPDVTVDLTRLGRGVLRVLAAQAGTRLRVYGEGTALDIHFAGQPHLAEPARLALAECL